jgi:hypothetical protein
MHTDVAMENLAPGATSQSSLVRGKLQGAGSRTEGHHHGTTRLALEETASDAISHIALPFQWPHTFERAEKVIPLDYHDPILG